MGVKAVAAGVTVYFGTVGSNRYMPDGKTKHFWEVVGGIIYTV